MWSHQQLCAPIWDTKLGHRKGSEIVDQPSVCVCVCWGTLVGDVGCRVGIGSVKCIGTSNQPVQ